MENNRVKREDILDVRGANDNGAYDYAEFARLNGLHPTPEKPVTK